MSKKIIVTLICRESYLTVYLIFQFFYIKLHSIWFWVNFIKFLISLKFDYSDKDNCCPSSNSDDSAFLIKFRIILNNYNFCIYSVACSDFFMNNYIEIKIKKIIIKIINKIRHGQQKTLRGWRKSGPAVDSEERL